jgi:hypothetical protein
MKSELAKKLKEVLNRMSQEEFNNDWEKIKSYNFEGPSINEALYYINYVQSNVSNFELSYSNISENITEDNYNLAA